MAAKSDNGGGVVKQTSQRSLLFRQNVNRTEAEWVHFLDGYRKALIEFDMKKFGDEDGGGQSHFKNVETILLK